MWEFFKAKLGDTTALMDQAFDMAVKETGAALDSETAESIKQSAQEALESAKKISLYLTDLNGDGKVDSEDIKLAAEKAGIVWDNIDPDLKTAMLAGGVAGVGVNFIPLFGQAVAIPAFLGTTVYFFLLAKFRGIGKK